MLDKFGLTDDDLSGIQIIRKTKGENMKHPIEEVLDNYGTYLKAVSKWAEAGNVHAVPTPPPLTKAERVIREICEALEQEPTNHSDGQVIDDVVQILRNNGYSVLGLKNEQEISDGNA